MFPIYKLLLIFLSLPLLLSANSPAEEYPFTMLRSNRITGIIPDINDGYGVSFRDYNQDGYADIYLVCFRNLNRLLVNNGGIIPFIDRTVQSGLGGYLMSHGKTNLELGVSGADYDNDGLPDVFLSGWGKTHRLFRNTGKIRFEDATSSLNAAGLLDINQGVWLDVNSDGYLDLYVTDEHFSNRLLVNQKNGSFEEQIWTNTLTDSANSQGACVADFDQDGDQDIYVCNWFHTDYLLLNNGNGIFNHADINLPTLVENYSGNSVNAADIDNDGDLDILVSTRDSLIFLYRNTSKNDTFKLSNEIGHHFHKYHEIVYGCLLEDFDHDGWLDCFISGKGKNRLYLNDKTGNFTKTYDEATLEAHSTGSAVADLDKDGDLDVLVSNKDQYCQIYLNPTNDNRFLNIRVIGVNSNRDALGTKVYFYNAEDSLRRVIGFREVSIYKGYLSSSDPVLHFGTGSHERINTRIVFPSGQEIERNNLEPGKFYVIYEYGQIVRTFYFAINMLRYQAGQKEFWWDLGLGALLILVIVGYLSLGLKRYLWTAFSVSLQLSLWFIITLALIVFIRQTGILISLIILNGISIFGAFISMIVSEYQRRLRQQRSRFRKIMQDLSDEIINIHENEMLFARIVETVSEHDYIQKTIFFTNDKDKLKPIIAGTKAVISIALSDHEQNILKDEKIIRIRSNTTHFIKFATDYNCNVLIPVRRKETLFCILGIEMINSDNLLNWNDLQQITTIANQTAVAIENNLYIKETADLIKQLTESQVRKQYVEQLEETNRVLDEKNNELTHLFNELQNKEAQLIHSEKMASLGQLVAGISHELNNPISFIYANMKVLTEYINELDDLLDSIGGQMEKGLEKKFEELMSEFRSIIDDSSNGSHTVKEIVQNLRSFSRIDQAEWKDASLVLGIESSLKILKHQIPNRIKIVTRFKDNPTLYCNPGQLNQVFVNLISNAAQAIEGEGEIIITTMKEKGNLKVMIQDTGKGIPEEIVPKIFDPFFTTKEVDKGTGLGLSISYSILKKHNAEIDIDSKPGKGTLFSLRFPLNHED